MSYDAAKVVNHTGSCKRSFILKNLLTALVLWTLALLPLPITAEPAEPLLIGLSYPRTGHYKEEGLAQMRGALLAVEQINQRGGVLGRPLALTHRDSSARPEKARSNIDSMAAEGAVMFFGSVSSAEAIAAGEQAREHDRLYFATIGYSNDVTTEKGHRHIFRESTSATMTGRALGQYLTRVLPNKKYFYITADYNWGHTTEASLREHTATDDKKVHPGVLVPFPNAKRIDHVSALEQAAASDAEVLVLALYGNELVRAMRIADSMGLNRSKQIVVPNLTQTVLEQIGPSISVGVIGTEHWLWRVPELEDSQGGIDFIDSYQQKYELYPSSAAASAYTVIHQWADAVQRSNSIDSERVRKALENHSYSLLKGPALWRAFDHQNVQTVYVIRVNDLATVIGHPSRQDYFEIVHRLSGEEAAIEHDAWMTARKAAGQPDILE
jgi:branched-chain amino acid transport system substrate-binding protein